MSLGNVAAILRAWSASWSSNVRLVALCVLATLCHAAEAVIRADAEASMRALNPLVGSDVAEMMELKWTVYCPLCKKLSVRVKPEGIDSLYYDCQQCPWVAIEYVDYPDWMNGLRRTLSVEAQFKRGV